PLTVKAAWIVDPLHRHRKQQMAARHPEICRRLQHACGRALNLPGNPPTPRAGFARIGPLQSSQLEHPLTDPPLAPVLGAAPGRFPAVTKRMVIMSFTLPELPYALDALAPHISRETLEYHHGKHHNAYVVNLNNLVPGTE